MKTKLCFCLNWLLVFVFFVSCNSNQKSTQNENTTEPTEMTANVDMQELADRIVNQCANIQEGEIVLVEGSARDLELLEDI